MFSVAMFCCSPVGVLVVGGLCWWVSCCGGGFACGVWFCFATCQVFWPVCVFYLLFRLWQRISGVVWIVFDVVWLVVLVGNAGGVFCGGLGGLFGGGMVFFFGGGLCFGFGYFTCFVCLESWFGNAVLVCFYVWFGNAVLGWCGLLVVGGVFYGVVELAVTFGGGVCVVHLCVCRVGWAWVFVMQVSLVGGCGFALMLFTCVGGGGCLLGGCL